MDSGIYQIKNNFNQKIYLGSSKNLSRRELEHFGSLRRGNHFNKHLQRAYNKYGKDVFEFRILARCPKEYCIKLEQWFLDNLKPLYNIRINATSNKGLKLSPEHVEKIRKAVTGRKMPKESLERRSLKMRGRKMTLEAREKMSKAKKGKPSPFTKEELKRRALLGQEKAKLAVSKRIAVLDDFGNIEEIFSSYREAGEKFKIHPTVIGKHLQGKYSRAAGKIWKKLC
jgi:group I intron endonuclease